MPEPFVRFVPNYRQFIEEVLESHCTVCRSHLKTVGKQVNILFATFGHVYDTKTWIPTKTINE